MTTAELLTRAVALRAAADAVDHDADYNATDEARWSPARRAENNRKIRQADELRDKAHALEKAAGLPRF